MLVPEIDQTLTSMYGAELQSLEAGLWQVETVAYRLLVLLSEDQAWLRMMIPITSAAEAEPFWRELLVSNFDATGEVRYGLYQEALWAVFQHALPSLTTEDFMAAIAQLVSLQELGLKDCFDQYIDRQVSLIIRAAKQQNMSLETTLQNLDRFYQEGVMGSLDDKPDVRSATLSAWQGRLERLWPTIDNPNPI
jgi:hypothetical protein